MTHLRSLLAVLALVALGACALFRKDGDRRVGVVVPVTGRILSGEARVDSLRDSVVALLARGVRDSTFPGACAVIGNRLVTLVEVCAGALDWGRDARSVDNRTVWDLASLTKVIGTTTAVLRLAEAGRLSLDDPVRKWIPEWKGPHTADVTLRHLLTHSSGLKPFRQLWKESSTADSALRLVFATPPDSAPGQRYVYSDLGFILLGQVVRRASGLPLDSLLARDVFGPLGMRDTHFRPPADWRERIAPTEKDPWRGRHLRGEVHDENAFLLGGVSGHAGLFSSAADLTRFAQMLLNGGTLGTTRILGDGSLSLLDRPQDARLSHRAIGWETPTGTNSAGTLLGRGAFGHTGFTGTSLWVDPSRDLFVLLLSNRVNPTRQNPRIVPVRARLADLAVRALASPPITPPAP